MQNEPYEEMLREYVYPEPGQEGFQRDIYRKREFYMHAIPERRPILPEERVARFHEKCSPEFRLTETQNLLANFINPNTPFRGLLIYHGTGVGKTCTAIAIAERFKPMVEKYGTRIHVLVSGPLTRQNFMMEILKCTGETYLKYFQDKTIILDEAEQAKIRKNALAIITQYYRIMSYRSFYRKVLGEKIKERLVVGNRVKTINRKTETGEYERDISINRIYSLDNTLLIVDEAHNLSENEQGAAVKKIIESSKNLKVILLTATPMKNLADEIVYLINLLRPPNAPIERDKVFTSPPGSTMIFKPGGKEYLRKMVRGYVSYLRGSDPLTFAERVDMGEIPPGLEFTRVTRCFMLPFQLETYRNVVATQEDRFERNTEAIANFVLPGISRATRELTGFYGIAGLNEMRRQLQSYQSFICQKVAREILSGEKVEHLDRLIYLAKNNVVRGEIFREPYLKYFSIKFAMALEKINQAYQGMRGPGLIFVYSNLVRVGANLFSTVLLENGYLEFQENVKNYEILPRTRCYLCGRFYEVHRDVMDHVFYPATFILVTGKMEGVVEEIPEEKHRVLKNIFNGVENKLGKYIKIVIGSVVMNEGITLKNIKEIHILDVHQNLGRVDQVIGRGIRFCTHYDLVNEENPRPKVEVYKYVISLPGELSSEELLYLRAEQKYRLIKETERILQEEAIDCPLNRHGNIFTEELAKYAHCGGPENPCPAICGYMPCDYRCADPLLNAQYYDPQRNIYRRLEKQEIDYTTYHNSLASEEVNYAKARIREMYRLNHVYTLDDILEHVEASYPSEKKDLFDEFYVYQALNDLIPVTTNDFNQFKDTVWDRFNRPGYLIYRGGYYIFQPFDENEDLPFYYREHYEPVLHGHVELKKYLEHHPEYQKFLEQEKIKTGYDFDSVMSYYQQRDEYDYVGIIDRETHRRTSADSTKDVFKIRPRRPKILVKKRQTGIPSFRGAICQTSRNRQFLARIIKKIGLRISSTSRSEICHTIFQRMHDLEKYATTHDGNKHTYLIVPANHPVFKFPLNLEDRLELIQRELAQKPKITSRRVHGEFPDIKYMVYYLSFPKPPDEYSQKILNKYGAVKEHGKWILK